MKKTQKNALPIIQKPTVLVKRLVALLAVVSLCSCVIQQAPSPDDPYYSPVLRPTEAPNPSMNGSLFSDNTAMNLFGDRKAKRIGDILTVVLSERTTSSKTSNVEVIKESDVSIPSVSGGAGTLFGTQPGLGNLNLGVNLQQEREFKGEAEADQSNRLNGSIAVSIVDIHPNGTLVVRGEKWITLNRGDEFIRVSGLVRPDDISPDNSVTSTKIANARITYSGKGELADSQEMGWLTRFFNNPLWPF